MIIQTIYTIKDAKILFNLTFFNVNFTLLRFLKMINFLLGLGIDRVYFTIIKFGLTFYLD